MTPKSALLLMTTSAVVALSPCTWAYAANDKSRESALAWLDNKDIALDPVLLKSDSLSDDQMEELLGSDQGAPRSAAAKTRESAPQTAKNRAAPSTLEQYYAERADVALSQFGYEMVPANSSAAKAGDAQDSYILGRGDELAVLIRGQENQSTSVVVDENGQLIIGTLSPIAAEGRSLADVRKELESLMGDYYNTEVFLSLAKTRRISVSVTGNVGAPGEIGLSSYATIMDAITASGGILKTGTLRQIRLIRGDESSNIDLYGMLIYGSGLSNMRLREGDRIQVGPIGPTLAISGAVKRPGIYEILPARQTLAQTAGNDERSSQVLSLDDVLLFAGGGLAPGLARYIRLAPDESGQDRTSEITDSTLKIFKDGDVLMVGKPQEKRAGSIELVGHSRADGLYALADTPTLSALLSSTTILGPDIYPLIGVIERWNPDLLTRELIVFSPKHIIEGADNRKLHESDKVILFSQNDIRALGSPNSATKEMEMNLASLGDAREEPLPKKASDAKNGLADFLLEHSVFIRGSVRQSGSYPITPDTTLESLLAVAGGPSFEASLGNIEITQPLADDHHKRVNINLATTPASRITLNPGDTIRINQKFRRVEDTHVVLVGEVRNPGTYDLLPGDTLGKLLERAGGITEQAYPQGAIFSRKSERLREEQRFKGTARDLELKLSTAMAQKDTEKRPSDDEIATARDLIAELKASEALGRITVEADPGMLAANPDMDILLESGDKIYMPKRPLTVRVAGEVLSPASLKFRSGKDPRTYIDEAGGFTFNADSDRAFVIFPDGSAQPLAVSAWNSKSHLIPPGSTIIVPRDPKPLTFMDGAKDLTAILANLATTAIFAEDLTDGR